MSEIHRARRASKNCTAVAKSDSTFAMAKVGTKKRRKGKMTGQLFKKRS